MFESSTLLASLRHSWGEIVAMLPDLALAVLLLIAGWLLAKLARRLAIRVEASNGVPFLHGIKHGHWPAASRLKAMQKP